MHNARWALRILLGLCVVTLSHCAAPRLADRPAATPAAKTHARELVQTLSNWNRQVTTLKAEARLRLSRGPFSRAVQQALVLRRPGQLRIDSYAPSGELLHQLVITGGLIQWVDAGEVRILSGDDVALLLEDELGLQLEARDLILILSGGVPLEAPDHYLAGLSAETVLLRGEDSQVLWDPDAGRPVAYAGFEGDDFFEVRFKDYRMTDKIWFPHEITLKMSDPNLTLKATYHEVTLNGPVSPGLFREALIVP